MTILTIISIALMTLGIMFDSMLMCAIGMGVVIFLFIVSKDFRSKF